MFLDPHPDLIHPYTLCAHQDLSSVPWRSRNNTALGRQTTFCTSVTYGRPMAKNGTIALPCARKHLLQLSVQHPDILDVKTLVDGNPAHVGGHVSIRDQGKYKVRWDKGICVDSNHFPLLTLRVAVPHHDGRMDHKDEDRSTHVDRSSDAMAGG